VISSRRGAPGRLGALYGKLPATQIGIGYYESVGAAATPATPAAPLPGSSQAATLVSAPAVAPAEESAAPLTQEQKAAMGALTVMGMFGAACLAAWAGYRITHSLRGTTA